jgi:hypothetical protein
LLAIFRRNDSDSIAMTPTPTRSPAASRLNDAQAPAGWFARFKHVVLAGVMTLAVLSPWLVRNVIETRNPVFPLASSVFGQGPWSDESAARFRAGHSAEFHPPVPVPPGYEPPQQLPSRRQRLVSYFLGVDPGDPARAATEPTLTALVLLLLAGTVLGMFLRPRGPGAWDWAMLGVLALQLAAWAAFTRNMPPRFICVAVPTMVLLISGGLERLAGVKRLPLLRQAGGAGGTWGLAPTVLLLLCTLAMGLVATGGYYRGELAAQGGMAPAGVPVADVYDYGLSKVVGAGKLMLVGDARAFLYPPGTVYATVFDTHPLHRILQETTDPPAVARRLAEMGVTHVLINWPEIERLTKSYGWPAEMSPDRLAAVMGAWRKPVREKEVWLVEVPRE